MIRRAVALSLFIGVVAVGLPLFGKPAGPAPGFRAGRAHDQFNPSKGKIFVLVIGSDARSGNPNARADALHLVGINAQTGKGGIINFPRDSWVGIPGSGSARINEALPRGGPELQVRTVEALTGIKIDYYVLTGFTGFQQIIRHIGGVKMRIPFNINDYGSGANLRAGKQHLSAEETLAYARTRKTISGGDIARTTNQARILLALLRKLHKNVARDPTTVFRWMDISRRKTRLDMSPGEMFRLAILATQTRAKDVKSVTVPVRVGSVGAASVVFIQPGARSLYDRLRRTGRL